MRLLILSAVLALFGSIAAVAAVAPGGTFIDDDGNLHEGAIEAIRSAQITTGCDPVGDLYCPSNSVTRAEMAAFIVRALGEPNPTPSTSGTFSDVAAGAWYEPFVERLVELDITTGFTDNTYRPDEPVTRAQMAAFVIRALGETESSQPTRFSDVASGVWFEGVVERLAELAITTGCDTNPLRYCPSDPVSRDQMASFVARAFDLPVEEVPARPSVQNLTLTKQLVASGLSSPLFLDAPVGDPRLFVVEWGGQIVVIDGGVSSVFLDISAKVLSGGERGFLGLAFHPQYSSNGLFYVHYSRAGDGAGVIAEYAVSGDPNVADATSERVLMTVAQPSSNHNGGMIAFGPDGYLYVGLGDGGGSNDQFGHGQRTDTVLATISRINVVSGGPAPGNPFGNEVFVYGLRNPWRFAFDGDRMYIGDVGQGSWEEVDVVDIYDGGANLGWPITEGSSCFKPSNCSKAGLTLPIAEYSHAAGVSITGGYVYRGSEIPTLSGHYFYGDFGFGWVGSFRFDGTGAVDSKTWSSLNTSSLASFGTDGFGELYIVSLGAGSVYKVVGG